MAANGLGYGVASENSMSGLAWAGRSWLRLGVLALVLAGCFGAPPPPPLSKVPPIFAGAGDSVIAAGSCVNTTAVAPQAGLFSLCGITWNVRDGAWTVTNLTSPGRPAWDDLRIRTGSRAILAWRGNPEREQQATVGGEKGVVSFYDFFPRPVELGDTFLLCSSKPGYDAVVLWDARPGGSAGRLHTWIPPCLDDGPGWYVEGNVTVTATRGPLARAPIVGPSTCLDVQIPPAWKTATRGRLRGTVVATWDASAPHAAQLRLVYRHATLTRTAQGPPPLALWVEDAGVDGQFGAVIPDDALAALNVTVSLHVALVVDWRPGEWPAGSVLPCSIGFQA